MKCRVKICGITQISDALAAAEFGAAAIGFMFFEESVRHISIEQAAAISRELPPFIARVGVFVNAAPERVQKATEEVGLDALQFHGEESARFCLGFKQKSIKAFRVKDAAVLDRLPEYATAAWLLDSYVAGQRGGTGEQFNWDLARLAKRHGRPIILAGGLNPANVREAVQHVGPFGVDVSSGVESAPGKKDRWKIRDFIQAAESAVADPSTAPTDKSLFEAPGRQSP